MLEIGINKKNHPDWDSPDPDDTREIKMTNKEVSNDHPKKLVAKIADRYGVDHNKMLSTLKNTAFKYPEPINGVGYRAWIIHNPTDAKAQSMPVRGR